MLKWYEYIFRYEPIKQLCNMIQIYILKIFIIFNERENNQFSIINFVFFKFEILILNL